MSSNSSHSKSSSVSKLGLLPPIDSFQKYLDPLTPTPNKPTESRRQKDFLELMGYIERSPKSALSSPLTSGKTPARISITDLMGNKKYDLLKQTGFMPMYFTCKKNEEFQHLVKQKNTLSFSNLAHSDKIREFHSKPLARKSDPLSEILKNPFTQDRNIKQMDEIFKQCDALIEENKQTKRKIQHRITVSTPVSVSKPKPKRKLTHKEINSIMINMQKIE